MDMFLQILLSYHKKISENQYNKFHVDDFMYTKLIFTSANGTYTHITHTHTHTHTRVLARTCIYVYAHAV
jgi:hypothetical protein